MPKAKPRESIKKILIEAENKIFIEKLDKTTIAVYDGETSSSFYYKNIPCILDVLIKNIPIGENYLDDYEEITASWDNRKIEICKETLLEAIFYKFKIYIDNKLASEAIYDFTLDCIMINGSTNTKSIPPLCEQFVNALNEAFDWLAADDGEDSE